jgi:hypothetical protein
MIQTANGNQAMNVMQLSNHSMVRHALALIGLIFSMTV